MHRTNRAKGEQVLKEGLTGKVNYLEFDRIWHDKYHESTTQEPIPLKEGVIPFLDHLKFLKISTAVATSTKHSAATKKLTDTQILQYFDVIIGGDQVKKSKPHPDIYLKAAETLGASPGRCLALEDSENGVRSAASAGMTVVQIPDLVPPSQELQKLGCIVLSSLCDVMRYEF